MLPIPTSVKVPLHLIFIALAAADKALIPAIPAWAQLLSALLSVLLGLDLFLTQSPAQLGRAEIMQHVENLVKGAGKIGCVFLFAGFALTQSGCTSSQWQQLVTQIEQGLVNGSILSSLEAIVAAAFPALASDAVAIDTILQDIVNLLVHSGSLPPTSTTHATDVLMQLKAKLGTGKIALSPEAERIRAELQAGGGEKLVAAVRAQLGAY